jgi:surface carbohydrate biosynthesis protein
VFLSHNARDGRESSFKRLKSYGHKIAVLDEESLIRQSDEIFLNKHSNDSFENVSRLLTWGESDAALWKNSNRIDNSIIAVTGNPRVDLLRPELRSTFEAEVDAIKWRYGAYVLINTNFPTVNHFIPNRSTLRLADGVKDDQLLKDKDDFLAYKRSLFNKFIEMIPVVAREISPCTLIIRPHPTESHAPWKELASAFKNIHVIFEGSVVPWLIGASVLVHNGCTSAVEATLLGTRVVNFKPLSSFKFDNPLTSALGHVCKNADEVSQKVMSSLASEKLDSLPGQKSTLDHYIMNPKNKLCADLIMDTLVAIPEQGSAGASSTLAINLRKIAAFYRKTRRHGEILLNKDRQLVRDKAEQKFAPLSAGDLQIKIAGFQSALNRFQNSKINSIGRNVFMLTNG